MRLKRTRILVALVFGAAIFSGCMAQKPNYVGAATGGALLGASTGAIVGSLIKNGSIIKSAGLGATLGIPAGLALVVAMNAMDGPPASEIDRTEEIKANQDQIFRLERDIEELRRDIDAESTRGQYVSSPRARVYNGQSNFNPYR